MSKQALISVSDKRGVVDLARALHQLGYRILSTGGTARLIAEAAIPVTEVADYTGFPEMLDGRVKTLNPRIHAGLLARRPDAAHMHALAAHAIDPIDILAVNLYPFEQTVARSDCTFDDAVENIDIGGPAMLRAAAKNHESVAAIVDPDDYAAVVAEPGRDGRADRIAGSAEPSVDQGAADALRREPASERSVLPRTQRRPRAAGRIRAAAGHGALVQQHRRRRRGVGMRAQLQRVRLRHRQARESLRRCHRSGRSGGLRQGLPHRSDISFRRHHRVQPHRRCFGG